MSFTWNVEDISRKWQSSTNTKKSLTLIDTTYWCLFPFDTDLIPKNTHVSLILVNAPKRLRCSGGLNNFNQRMCGLSRRHEGGNLWEKVLLVVFTQSRESTVPSFWSYMCLVKQFTYKGSEFIRVRVWRKRHCRKIVTLKRQEVGSPGVRSWVERNDWESKIGMGSLRTGNDWNFTSLDLKSGGGGEFREVELLSDRGGSGETGWGTGPLQGATSTLGIVRGDLLRNVLETMPLDFPSLVQIGE